VNFEIRKATEADTPLIAWFIRQLAEYERLLEETTMTEETLRESLFGPRSSTEVLLGYYEERPVAFAVFFHNFSTFVGKRGLYLEDLFVIPEMRGKGFGRALLVHLSKIARERNCGRLNEPAIEFYKRLGAVAMNDWTIFRMTGEALDRLAEERSGS